MSISLFWRLFCVINVPACQPSSSRRGDAWRYGYKNPLGYLISSNWSVNVTDAQYCSHDIVCGYQYSSNGIFKHIYMLGDKIVTILSFISIASVQFLLLLISSSFGQNSMKCQLWRVISCCDNSLVWLLSLFVSRSEYYSLNWTTLSLNIYIIGAYDSEC